MMSKCWKSGDTEVDVIAKLKAAQTELLLIIENEDVNACDIIDLRSVNRAARGSNFDPAIKALDVLQYLPLAEPHSVGGLFCLSKKIVGIPPGGISTTGITDTSP
jgi:hypothetical protein